MQNKSLIIGTIVVSLILLFAIGPAFLLIAIPTFIWLIKILRDGKKDKEEVRQKKLNRKAPIFRYAEYDYSVRNKYFNLAWLMVFVLGLIAYFGANATENNSWAVFVVLGITYLCCVCFSVYSSLKDRKRKASGTKCEGKIIAVLLKRRYNYIRARRGYGYGYHTSIKLKIEYYNQKTGKTKEFVTPYVNINPLYSLSSTNVTVYEQADGSAWATDFVQAEYKKDTLQEQGIEITTENL